MTMADYVPPYGLITNEDVFANAFQRLSKQDANRRNWYYLGVALVALAYVVFISYSAELLYKPSLARIPDVFVLVPASVFVIAGFAVASHSQKFRLKVEEKAFLHIFKAKLDIEAYAKNPTETYRLKEARESVRLAALRIPVAGKTSIITTRALKGTDELRNFMNMKLNPYLKDPQEPSRVIHSLGYLSQLLLDPSVEGIPFVLERLKELLPESVVPQEVGVAHATQKYMIMVWSSSISRRPFVSALVLTLAILVLVVILVNSLGAPLSYSVGGAGFGFLPALWVVYQILKSQSNPGE